LVKRVEVDKHNVRIVYKVPARPIVKSPHRGLLQHCCRRQCNPFSCPWLSRVDTALQTPWRDGGEGGQGGKNPYFYSGLRPYTLPANRPFLVAGSPIYLPPASGGRYRAGRGVSVPFPFGGKCAPPSCHFDLASFALPLQFPLRKV
jgi:hypothetical protein